MRAISIIFFGLIAAVSAQTQSNLTSCCNVTPSTIPENTRLSWCRAQQNTCPQICDKGQTSANNCDQSQLTFECTCLNGNTPNISDFAQSLPSLQCDEWKKQCTDAHPNDLNGQTFCQSFNCGRRNATALNNITPAGGSSGGSGSGSGGSSSAGGSSSTGTSTGAPASSSKGAASALRIGREYGTGAVLLGLTAVFGLVL